MKQEFRTKYNVRHRGHNYSKSAIPYTICKGDSHEEVIAVRSHYGLKKITEMGGHFKIGNYISRIGHKKSASITVNRKNGYMKIGEKLPDVIVISGPSEVVMKGGLSDTMKSGRTFSSSMQKLGKGIKFKKYSHNRSHNRSKSDQLLLQQQNSKRTLKDNHPEVCLFQDDEGNNRKRFIRRKKQPYRGFSQLYGKIHHSLKNPVVCLSNSIIIINIGKCEMRSNTSNHSPKNSNQYKKFFKSKKLEAVMEKNKVNVPLKYVRPSSGVCSQPNEQNKTIIHTNSNSKDRSNVPNFIYEFEKIQLPHKSGIVLANYAKKKSENDDLGIRNKNKEFKESKRGSSENKKVVNKNAIKLIINRKKRNQSNSSHSGDSSLPPMKLTRAPNKVIDLPINLEIKILTKDPTIKSIIKELKLDTRREKEMLETVKLIRIKAKNNDLKTDIAFYKIGKILGKGAFGRVSLGIHKLTGKLVAVKSINKQVMTDENSKNKVTREHSIWEKLQHPSIIQLYEVFESDKHLLYIEELCAGGDLLTYVRKRRRLKEPIAKYVLKQILEGLHYCHLKSILHRDIKLDNILLNAEGRIKVKND